ncbi:MAG: hypothetical protein WDN48_14640 [Pseudolabrys sp.]
MLRGIHKASSTWLGRGIMGVIMAGPGGSASRSGASADIFRGFGANSVAKIGGTEISVEQFRQYYTDKLSSCRGNSTGRSRPIWRARWASTVNCSGNWSRDYARRAVEEAAARLERRRYRATHHQRPELLRHQRQVRPQPLRAGHPQRRLQRNPFRRRAAPVLLRRQIAQSISGDLPVPSTTLAAINQFQNEKRTIDYVLLTAAQAGDIRRRHRKCWRNISTITKPRSARPNTARSRCCR